ncbi:glutathione S-transferase family protein [Halorubrum sp. 48-1-W]|uniref:glutathione S-transferase family protein n=1 Tax=Halorubrum sp. 48-1-W TaxID=2249761 RepID=UPI000DCCA3C5|nr:glutathione S-transferase family protein [Halorubrum sp. 48-1-W]RAW44923.1 glutathione S-transferase family protein [Halorubrum sp. 48-1-W]
MNQLVDGEWRTDAYESTDEEGAFQRGETTFRDWIAGSDVPAHVDAEPDDRFQPEAGRYHLYVSYACPWAHRTLLARSLLELEDAIGVSVVDPWRGEDGWQFSPEKDGCTPDRVHGSDYLRELYAAADPDATCRVTVPVLWDTAEETVVNNESREILRMLTTAFDGLGDDVSLLPDDPEARDRVDEVVTEIYEPVNNGVYRAGFATSQTAYDEAIDDLFGALDRWDAHLAENRYLVGEGLTEADLCLFTTLVRFDQVYHTHFMCDRQYVHQYEHLWPYLRDLYTTPGVAKTVNMDHIKEHYYTTHPDVTPSGIVARGPDLDWEESHGRDRLAGSPPTPRADD